MAVNWPVSTYKQRMLLPFIPQVFLEFACYSFKKGQIEGAQKSCVITLAVLIGQPTLPCDRQLGNVATQRLNCIHI